MTLKKKKKIHNIVINLNVYVLDLYPLNYIVYNFIDPIYVQLENMYLKMNGYEKITQCQVN